MTRWVLNALYVVLLMLAAPYWLWKAPSARRYRAGLLQRLGLVPRRPAGVRRLWVHCASVGEAAIPRDLVAQFRRNHPDWEVVFSTFTDTGAARLRELYPDSAVFYWPLDVSLCVDAALERVAPSAVLLVELEIWPNFLLGCRARGVPMAVVNGRINPRSVELLRGVSRLCGGLWDAVGLCCARSAEDARRFAEAGMARERIFDTGSLKYDVLPLAPDMERLAKLRALFGIAEGGKVIVAGSTFPGEDEALCGAWQKLRGRHEGLRLILAPRHIERADAVARSLRSAGATVARKTDLDAGAAAPAPDAVIMVDTIGDLMTCYGLATVAFVGRSLFAPGGGQNMMEPAAFGRPVVVGPHNGNFRPEMSLLLARGAVVVVGDEAALVTELDRLLSDAEAARSLGEKGRRTVMESRGAARRTLERVETIFVWHRRPRL